MGSNRIRRRKDRRQGPGTPEGAGLEQPEASNLSGRSVPGCPTIDSLLTGGGELTDKVKESEKNQAWW